MRMNRQTFFTSKRAALAAGFAVAAALMLPLAAQQTPATTPEITTPQILPPQSSTPQATTPQATTAPDAATPEITTPQILTPQNTPAQASATMSNTSSKKKPKVAKEDKVVQSKDTRIQNKKEAKLNPLAG